MLLLLIFCSLSLYPLNPSISLFNKKKSPKDFYNLETEDALWHLKFFNTRSFSSLSGKNIQIVIIDGEISSISSIKEYLCSNLKKISQEERIKLFNAINQKKENLSLCLMKKKYNLQNFIKKNHAEITTNLIQQIAHQAKIDLIPILDQDGSGSKLQLYQALQEALLIKPDILHLGIQVIDFDPKLELDKKILKILKKFRCVVAPAGNYGEKNDKVGFPARCSFVISVGSFYKKGNTYPISHFCQTLDKVDFIMPGENVWVEAWIPELNDYCFIPTRGTSISAALMTGSIACLLEKYPKTKRINIKKILKQSSTKLDPSWGNAIMYGLPLL